MFGRKKEKQNNTTSQTSKAEFKVVIKEKFSKGTTTLKTISVKREIDPDDYVVYLSNVSEQFLELMPQDENDFEQLNAKEIDLKLAAAKKALKKEKTAEDKGTNEQNFLYEVMKLEAKKQSLIHN